MDEKKEKKQQDENLEQKQNEKAEKKKKVTQMKEELEEMTDRYKRVLAEFENFKKRSQKEREQLYNSILSDIIEVILPVSKSAHTSCTKPSLFPSVILITSLCLKSIPFCPICFLYNI